MVSHPDVRTENEKYLAVRTGQDLVDLGVRPKTSSQHLSLITRLRLEAIRDEVLRTFDEEVLGKWVPALVPINPVTVGPVIDDAAQVLQYAAVGMRAKVTNQPADNTLMGLEGRIVTIESGMIGVEFDTEIPKGYVLNGKARDGHGWKVRTKDIALMLEKPLTSAERYELATGVVADATLGFKVRFSSPYRGTLEDRGTVEIPADTTGTLTEYHPRKQTVKIQFDSPVNTLQGIEIPLKSIAESLEVSSLGGALPQDKDETVHEEVLRHFFPRGKYETELAERIIVGMLLGKDMYFHGPPGSGKSTAGKDIQKLARQQDLIFIVEGCQVQCNPFSLFDAEFGKRCPPCPECMINYDADFRETGRFTPPDPKTVKVTVAQYSEGHGIEFTEGTAGLRRYHIAGYKQPDLSGAKKTSSDFDPEGYTAGVLTRTNNGILLLEEADKLHPDLQHSLHEALEADRAKPDQMRFSVPANSLLLLTANDPSAFIDTLRDRMFGISIHYADNVDVAHEVTRAGYHGIVRPESVVVLPDTHAREPFDVWHTMMPVVLERAVEAFYIKFRAEYDGPGKDIPILGTGRCKFDAFKFARALRLFDSIFYQDTPSIVDEDLTILGIQYAFHARVAETDRKREGEVKQVLSDWVEEMFPKCVQEENSAWWCRAYQYIANAQIRAPTVQRNFEDELIAYERDPHTATAALQRVQIAYQQPNSARAQEALLKSPFMDYLFHDQPGLDKINPRSDSAVVTELVRYCLKTRAAAACSVGK